MTAVVYPIKIEQGADWSLSMIWKDDEGVPLDISDCRAEFRMRPSHSSNVLLLSLDSDPNGGIVLGGVAGSVDIFASAEQTATLTGTAAVYNLKLISESLGVLRMMQGAVIISPEV